MNTSTKGAANEPTVRATGRRLGEAVLQLGGALAVALTFSLMAGLALTVVLRDIAAMSPVLVTYPPNVWACTRLVAAVAMVCFISKALWLHVSTRRASSTASLVIDLKRES